MPEIALPAFAPAWPEGVVARYLTVAGATVDLRRYNERSLFGECTGCGHDLYWSSDRSVRERAQAHAETCRALPRPTAG